MTQIEFVKQLPADLPVEEVVKKAQARGLKLRPARVKVIRRELKNGAHLTLVPTATKPGRPSRSQSLERARHKLLELVFLIGIRDTNELIAEARARVEALAMR